MESFNLPIYYTEHKVKVEEHIMDDLELQREEDTLTNGEKQTGGGEEQKSKVCIYDHVFNPGHTYSKKMMAFWSKYYTSDTEYIKDTQYLLKQRLPNHELDLDTIEEISNDIKTETGFHNKYKYIDSTWPIADTLNNSAPFLLLLGMYNILSPVLTLAMPVFCLIVPFFIIKLQGYPITLEKYKEVLIIVIKRHQLGKLFSLGSAQWNQRIYILVSLVFYVFQIYQHIMSCLTFHKNSITIHSRLQSTRDYLLDTLETMHEYDAICNKMKSYGGFVANMNHHMGILKSYYSLLLQVKLGAKQFRLANIHNMGCVMLCFNKLYNDKNVIQSLEYSLYFHGYLENMRNAQTNIKNKIISLCRLTRKYTKVHRRILSSIARGNCQKLLPS